MQLKSLCMAALLAISCLGCTSPQLASMEGHDLSLDGFTAFDVDNQMLVVLSTDRLFEAQRRDHINPRMYSAITRLARIIKHDQPTKVEIYAYANRHGLAYESLRLTQRQARTLASYLWSQGLDAKHMVSKGFGQSYPVDKTPGLTADVVNNRIEVRWQTHA